VYSVVPADVSQSLVQSFLVGGVAPRPIALVSTINSSGVPNLSPFSFYNSFGSNPPVIAFSASRRGRDGTLKDTYNNLIETGECVVNAVTHSIMEQVNLSSTEYPPDIDEWAKSGLTPINSDLVKPSRVMESPFQMECILHKMVSVGDGNGSANIAICEVVKFHIDESIMTEGKIDPLKIHHIGRNGGDFWSRSDENSLFILPKPKTHNNVGFDGLPDFIIKSTNFTSNEIARFGLLETLPTEIEMKEFISNYNLLESTINDFMTFRNSGNMEMMLRTALFLKHESGILEITAREFLSRNLIREAYCICLFNYLNK
jgi:flavin reductase (DIM6/NTAB) family NADH-FMN oxidoreductase RutF